MPPLTDDIYQAAVQRPARFKNPKWKTPYRRHKPLRQLLSDEQKRLNNTDVDNKDGTNGNARKDFNQVTYFSLDAYPSLKPRKHYCDITGLKGNYKTPNNGLRYYNVEVYNDVIKTMTSGVDQQYLELRNANIVLK
ncbi:Ies6p ASCRUDRAFT_71842 [Ascoidea rubescens DSM 1968]|uniref:Vps72/YL1 C-terminal domain-containing protein n=1 Tax=Ascoidea rubescens DSM 1968 TaxID=1344418 RepID=A0A1D2VDC6_9ASCO|nr:hypothetical protein ASCRUDRAFT_71842 [Ascoidea rubescens DSM 1968]ODV59493.1 hypothetical protein ASCRUDRAFT_71842 [Ascoidea rubescens DSM 1968]